MSRTKLKSESDILSLEFRKKVIEEITGPENVLRKNHALRAYEIFNGQTKKWVIEMLSNEFEPETVAQMQTRATNISILRKVVSKLANTYTAGVTRKVNGKEDPNDATQKAVDELAEAVKMNITQDKADRFYELFRNSLVSTVPIKNYRESEDGKPKFDLSLRVLPPHFYDVIEDESNPEVPRVIILTDFVEANQGTAQPGVNVGPDGRPTGIIPQFTKGDGHDQVIADSRDDAGKEKREFIWWSDNYHFTTDEKGQILTDKGEEDNKNPIGELPFVVYAGDQDGGYYASNWQDKVDGAIHINVALTDMFCIAMVQGWGQPVLTGAKFPEKVKGGPHRAILLKQQQGDPEAKFYYATSNPPLDQWMRMVELEVALYLSTNNLSPTTVSAKLDVQNFPSGIAMMIERSESTADITKKHAMYQDGEQDTIKKLSRWQEELGKKDALTEKFKKLSKVPKEAEVKTLFLPVKPIVSEKEHVETMKARKDLGIDTMLQLIMRDDPSLTKEQAEEKLAELTKEKDDAAAKAMKQQQDMGGDNAEGNQIPGKEGGDPKAGGIPKQDNGSDPVKG